MLGPTTFTIGAGDLKLPMQFRKNAHCQCKPHSKYAAQTKDNVGSSEKRTTRINLCFAGASSVALFSTLLLLTIISLLLSQAEARTRRVCPKFGPMKSFREEGLIKRRYLGRWYQQDHEYSLTNLKGKCWSQVYSRKQRKREGDPYALTLTVEHVSKKRDDYVQDKFDISILDEEDPNLMYYDIGNPQSSGQTYRVIGTDYSTFAIEYSCQDYGPSVEPDGGSENVWILTRDRHPSAHTLRRAYDALRALGLQGYHLSERQLDDARGRRWGRRRESDVCRLAPSRRSDEGLRHKRHGSGRRKSRRRKQPSSSSPPPPTSSYLTPLGMASQLGSSISQVFEKVFTPWASLQTSEPKKKIRKRMGSRRRRRKH